MSTLVKYPIHEVKIFSPGPWGAYRYHDMDYQVEGLENNAWNKIVGPELRSNSRAFSMFSSMIEKHWKLHSWINTTE